mmetsp:Transcript_24721/g.41802  ORF Transcript_24721/g.41802 Transcript_24721/m.41802 type:complete len:269 (+) Transcript_24721:94-900(+)|eukprot:CAMPEP_0114433704 /NCGR_PEP_ID=MMETSP0103-20121206/11841_1 /TAXON_ID=37642 ORGANISM="Paraphysomonas imperforata, Strain PA2" /NCGR_SAMPLE_ID=MMETSP0103 /ASSEMBLY_ACC=CAM_ASM_000201 /LENGTH=268 /DNA_ID=CAMNT_0001603485 /DNA_START=79 /DNA_END=885 /DNA_ORIENTATION=+
MNQSSAQPVWIYHEQQDSLLCGQHALNNLIQQQNFFDAGQLAEIAHQLDAQEQIFMGGNLSGPSGNVDAQGNFSIQVITNALANFGIDLTVWSMKFAESDPSLEEGFIVNRDAHWFSIRKINNKWWDLNSAKETPEYISEFYLGAFLTQLSSDGYSVFVARGNYPRNSFTDMSSSDRGPFWHLESALRSTNSTASAPIVDKFSGRGNRLGSNNSGDTDVHAEIRRTTEEDDDLARAIAMSVADMKEQSAPAMTEKERIRAKRLAAMGR